MALGIKYSYLNNDIGITHSKSFLLSDDVIVPIVLNKSISKPVLAYFSSSLGPLSLLISSKLTLLFT